VPAALAERDRMALELDGLTYPRYAVSLAEAPATKLPLGHDVNQVLAGRHLAARRCRLSRG